METGPREFLVVSVIYCARWIWLYLSISRSRSRKAFAIALQLRRLKTVRLGASTRKPDDDLRAQVKGLTNVLRARFSQIAVWAKVDKRKAQFSTQRSGKNLDKRNGEKELVIRRGARTASGTTYWRGVEEEVRVISADENRGSSKIYLVRLVERELHSSHLDEIGTCDFKRSLDVEGPDGLYKKIYELVMTCDSQSSELLVDYSSFLTRFEGGVAADTAPAMRVGATSNTVLGDVARRVAADACYYVFHDGAELRTGNHVKCINECIEHAAMRRLGIDNEDLDSMA